jgi:uncharacterized protein YcaQ
MPLSLDHLRRYAVARSLFKPTTLKRAIHRMSFVQADPIRAPARAQDLILRHRVRDYRAGDLERLYTKLGIEEDFFLVYGFMTRELRRLMHPRADASVPASGCQPWPPGEKKKAAALLEFVRTQGTAHPREVDAHFSHGTVTNYWGGSSNATTHLLDAMHYRGMVRVHRRKRGIRIYTSDEHGPQAADEAERHARLDALVDIAVGIYAPLPGPCLTDLVRRLRFAVPQWRSELTGAQRRAKQRLATACVDGVDWYWPAGENPARSDVPDTVRILTPFDPIVWDRDRLELLWGWVYRFEAYTPAAKRKLGYYAMPLLWRDRIIGWANLSVKDRELQSEFGYIESNAPPDPAYNRELTAELDRMRIFLGL